MKKNRPLFAMAALAMLTAGACLSAQEDPPAHPEAYKTNRSTSTRYIFFPHLGDTIAIFPYIGWGEEGADKEKGDAEELVLPFMQEFPQIFKGKKVLDIGTGSGIIALYAAKLGAAKVVATDIDPQAVKNTRHNARRLGLDSVIRTRLVTPEDLSAYAVIRPGEVFDTIVANADAQLDESYGSEKDSRPILGLSILGGLKQHLKPDGSVILLYRFKFLHDLMVGYARYLGYNVEHHEAVSIPSQDWCSLYSVYSAEISRRENLPAKAFRYPEDCQKAFGASYIKQPDVFPPLWGKKLDRNFPGLILIRNKR